MRRKIAKSVEISINSIKQRRRTLNDAIPNIPLSNFDWVQDAAIQITRFTFFLFRIEKKNSFYFDRLHSENIKLFHFRWLFIKSFHPFFILLSTHIISSVWLNACVVLSLFLFLFLLHFWRTDYYFSSVFFLLISQYLRFSLDSSIFFLLEIFAAND